MIYMCTVQVQKIPASFSKMKPMSVTKTALCTDISALTALFEDSSYNNNNSLQRFFTHITTLLSYFPI